MNKNRIISALLSICMLFCLCSCTSESVVTIEEASTVPTIINASETEAPKNDIDYSEHSFEIHYIDVGQGDAALAAAHKLHSAMPELNYMQVLQEMLMTQ